VKLFAVLLVLFSIGTLFTTQPSLMPLQQPSTTVTTTTTTFTTYTWGITVSTDKSTYSPSEAVQISGTVTGGQYCPTGYTCTFTADIIVELEIRDPLNTIVYSKSLSLYPGSEPPIRSFSDSFSLSSALVSGGYQVVARATCGGYPTVQASSIFRLEGTATTIVISRLTLSPISGPTGIAVTVSASNYAGTTCTLSSSPSGLFSSYTCSISGGILTGAFTVTATGASGSYAVTVATDVGESGTASFYLINDLVHTLSLNPTSGPVGTAITISGSSYAGTTCILSSWPLGLFSSSSYSISGGMFTGGFTVASDASPRSYVVTVTTDAGETGSGVFTVTAPPTRVWLVLDRQQYTVGDTVEATAWYEGSPPIFPLHVEFGFYVFDDLRTQVASAWAATTNTYAANQTVQVSWKFEYTIPTNARPGLYQAHVIGGLGGGAAIPSQYPGGGYTVNFLVLGTPALGSLSVNFDKTTYMAGDTVQIVGGISTPNCTWTYTITGTPGGQGLEVAIMIYDPNGLLVLNSTTQRTASTYKQYAYDYVLSATAIPGSYSVVVSYGSHEVYPQPCAGGSLIYGQGTFQVASTTTPATTPVTAPATTPAPPPTGTRCIIASAAYGSEMAPDVVYMRYVRDNMIGSSTTGRTLVAAFNAFYYSWSPAVATIISESELLRAAFRVILLPVIGIVHITGLVFMAMTNMAGSSDLASTAAFLVAATMTIAVYVALPVLVALELERRIRRRRA